MARPTGAEIVRHHEQTRPDADAIVPGFVAFGGPIQIEEHKPEWAKTFEGIATTIRNALGHRVIALHHVGSTAVAGLPAKPVIDIDLVVDDPADEAMYINDLVAAGFVHAIREPWWHEHRLVMLRTPRAHVHIFGPDCPEVVRHLMFRDWLCGSDTDREIYAYAKRSAASTTNADGGSGMDYNRNKEAVVREIYHRMFVNHGLL
jgi:GrpB-like predicted nucleotidyltransferase (UPF0157 family)